MTTLDDDRSRSKHAIEFRAPRLRNLRTAEDRSKYLWLGRAGQPACRLRNDTRRCTQQIFSHSVAMRPLTEEETKIFFEKLAKYIGRNIKFLIDRPDEPHCFRLHNDRVYYVR